LVVGCTCLAVVEVLYRLVEAPCTAYGKREPAGAAAAPAPEALKLSA
jgi:hypothetical protein